MLISITKSIRRVWRIIGLVLTMRWTLISMAMGMEIRNKAISIIFLVRSMRPSIRNAGPVEQIKLLHQNRFRPGIDFIYSLLYQLKIKMKTVKISYIIVLRPFEQILRNDRPFHILLIEINSLIDEILPKGVD